MAGAVTTVAWFHCFAGIAGDMALGACLDAGAELDEVITILERLPVTGWALETELVMRGGLAATKAHVKAKPDGITRTYGHIAGIIEEARLPERVRQRTQRVFRLLAETEGKLHRRPTASVHFHEVGGIDAIVDIVGTCAALEVLGVDDVSASTVRVGTGVVRTSHGLLPNPSPAVVDLLREAPVVGLDVNIELTTPTGAALLAGLCSGYGPMPPMRLRASGFGAGTKELGSLPNLVQIAVGQATSAVAGAGTHQESNAGEPLALLEANLDDISGEVVAHAVDALLAAGALDAWTAHVTMKKGRPGVVLSALGHLPDAPSLRDVIAHETGTLGVRISVVERWPFARQPDEVEVEGLPVRIKRTALRVKVEYEDAARVARRTGLPLREVVSRAEAEARRTAPHDGGEAS
ncbi:MAG TPA: nickel pincer cofactor biosynthesis protein LarC [Acidimicrobiia bacterium]|nr:nickel pincer cofactor biosynthesis protein LarC [Acidimicrobiia bacterium]